jgi:predicted nucleic acid-binding protein
MLFSSRSFVAAALELKAERFWTFDERQARLAEAEGSLTV